MHLVACTNTCHDVTDLLNHEMFENTNTGISWERNIAFLGNKKIFSLCFRWHILWSYCFVAEVTFKEKTLELEHNQDKYALCFFCSIFKYPKFLSMLSTFSLYIFLFIFDISFFLRDHNGNKSVKSFCAIPVAIDFLIAFRNSITIL